MTQLEALQWREVPCHKRPPEVRDALRSFAEAEKVVDLRWRLRKAHEANKTLRLKVAARDARILALEELLEEAREERILKGRKKE